MVAVALELGTSLSLPELVHALAVRAGIMFGARATAVALAHGDLVETVIVHGPQPSLSRQIQSRLTQCLTAFAETAHDPVSTSDGEKLLGADLHSDLKWNRITIARLTGTDGELLGLLSLADTE